MLQINSRELSVGVTRGVRHERKSRTLWQKSIGNHWKSVGNHGNLARNQKSGPSRNQEISEKSQEILEKERETPPFCLSMRSRPFAHAHLRNPRESVTRREISWKSVGNQLEISWKSVGNHSEGGKSVGNHRNPEISYAEKARVVPLASIFHGERRFLVVISPAT